MTRWSPVWSRSAAGWPTRCWPWSCGFGGEPVDRPEPVEELEAGGGQLHLALRRA